MGKRLGIPVKRDEPEEDYKKLDVYPRIFRLKREGKQYLKSNSYSENELLFKIATYRGTLEQAVEQICGEYGLMGKVHYFFERKKIKPKQVAKRRWNAKLFD